MAPATRRGPTTTPTNTNQNNMTLESVQAMIDQAFQRNSSNGDGSHSSGGDDRRNVQTARPCFYADFMKCQPLNFKGTEGVVGLTRWIEKMESIFNISGCAIENQVKFATCTLLAAALTWWNGQFRTLGPDAYAMTWEVLKKKMMDKYCPQGEIKKLENDLWNLKLCTYAERQTDNKRKTDDLSRNNHGHQQQPFKKQNVAKAYTVGSGEWKEYVGTLPLCNKCKFHHHGPCTVRCANCKKVDHLTRDCWNPTATSNQRTITCYECGNQGHYRSDCPELKNQGTEARGEVYALKGEGTNQDTDSIDDEIEALDLPDMIDEP
ncbi:reverse transcriptase domain-containing protein [Tanacetum coccineum]